MLSFFIIVYHMKRLREEVMTFVINNLLKLICSKSIANFSWDFLYSNYDTRYYSSKSEFFNYKHNLRRKSYWKLMCPFLKITCPFNFLDLRLHLMWNFKNRSISINSTFIIAYLHMLNFKFHYGFKTILWIFEFQGCLSGIK